MLETLTHLLFLFIHIFWTLQLKFIKTFVLKLFILIT